MTKKIFIIDDDEGILEGFHALLESEGYTVISTKSGQSSKTIIKDESPDLILLDVLLSGEDGRDICRSLKADTSTKDIPVIMISAQPNAEKTTLDAGADAYLDKPFEMDDLLTMISNFIKTS